MGIAAIRNTRLIKTRLAIDVCCGRGRIEEVVSSPAAMRCMEAEFGRKGKLLARERLFGILDLPNTSDGEEPGSRVTLVPRWSLP